MSGNVSVLIFSFEYGNLLLTYSTLSLLPCFRVIDEDNPLYNPEAIKLEPEWHTSVDYHKYKNFVLYVHRYLNPANETEADLYHLTDSDVAVFYPQLPGYEDRPYDDLQVQAIESFKDVLDQHASGKWTHGLPRAAHINREHGRQQVVLFDCKLNPSGKNSIKGTVLDSFAINNQFSPEGPGSCGHETTLTPVVLSPCDSNDVPDNGKKKNKRNRKKKNGNAANGEEMNGNAGGSENHKPGSHAMCGRTDSHKPHVITLNQIDPNCSVHGHGNRACGMDPHNRHHHACDNNNHPSVVATKDRQNHHVHVACTKCGKQYTSVATPVRREKHILVRKPVRGGEGKEVALHMVTSQNPHLNPHTHKVSRLFCKALFPPSARHILVMPMAHTN